MQASWLLRGSLALSPEFLVAFLRCIILVLFQEIQDTRTYSIQGGYQEGYSFFNRLPSLLVHFPPEPNVALVTLSHLIALPCSDPSSCFPIHRVKSKILKILVQPCYPALLPSLHLFILISTSPQPALLQPPASLPLPDHREHTRSTGLLLLLLPRPGIAILPTPSTPVSIS